LGGPSELECREKLNKIRNKMNNRVKDVRKDFTKIEKLKVDLLNRTEEIKRRAEHSTDKMEAEITKSKHLAPESKQRLRSEIMILKSEVYEKHEELRTRVAAALVPA
jgi:hypothetical protein